MVDNLLLDPTTTGRNVQARAQNKRTKLTKIIAKHLGTGVSIAITLDL